MNFSLHKYTVLLTAFLFLSCSKGYYVRKGDSKVEMLRYKESVNAYKKGLNIKKPSAELYVKLAKSYLKLNDYSNALAILNNASNTNKLSIDSYKLYSEVLMMNGNHSKAAGYLTEYLKTNPNNRVAQNWLAVCNNIQKQQNATNTTLSPVAISGFIGYFSPTIHNNELYFSAEKETTEAINPWDDQSFIQLYAAKIEKDKLIVQPRIVGNKLQNQYNVGIVSIPKGKERIYFSSNQIKKKSNFIAYYNNTSYTGIYVTELVNGVLSNTYDPIFAETTYNSLHPSINASETLLFFAADMPSGYGGYDIYYAKKVNDKWSSPINAGSVINTPGNELFPLLTENSELFFSSDGHESFGGLDIFYTKYTNPGDFQAVKNMGMPLNSSADDFDITLLANNTGYISSNRSGKDIIYYFENKIDTTSLSSILILPKDFEPTHTNNKETATKMSTNEHKTQNKPKRIIIQLKDVLYDYNKWDIRSDTQKVLDKLVNLLMKYPSIKIKLQSYADQRGSNQYNLELSQKRSESAVKYITSKGVVNNRISANYFGESMPQIDCDIIPCSGEQYQENRRTEIKIYDFDPNEVSLLTIEQALISNKIKKVPISDAGLAPGYYIIGGSYKELEEAKVSAKEFEKKDLTHLSYISLPLICTEFILNTRKTKKMQ